MTRVIITGNVPGIGLRRHQVRAINWADAWAKFCRAYPGRECVFIEVTTTMGQALKGSGWR